MPKGKLDVVGMGFFCYATFTQTVAKHDSANMRM